MTRLRRLPQNADAQAIFALILLWLFFFWRLFTPIAADQASLAKGDFSGQFVGFRRVPVPAPDAGRNPAVESLQ